MYIVLEYLAYLAGVLVLGGLLFGATVLVIVTQSGAEQLSKMTRDAANHARLMTAGFPHAKIFGRTQSSTSTSP